MVNSEGELISVTGTQVCPTKTSFEPYNRFYHELVDYPAIKDKEKIEESLNCVIVGRQKFY